jgi:two-component system KDP operon response regulator KdpE
MEYPTDQDNLTSARLLVVDDEPNIRSALAKALSFAGYNVEEASSGQEALELLQHKRFDLLVLDMLMPEVSGLDVMRRMRKAHPDFSIIVLTGHATLESAIAAARTDEVVDYLQKPVKNREIIDAVDRALQKRSEQLHHRRLFDAVSRVLDVAAETGVSVPSNSPAPPVAPDREAIVAPPLALNRKKRLLTIEYSPPRTVELTKGETAVLSSLMVQPGKVLSCEELVSNGWGYDVDEFEAKSIIRPHIRRLRQKLESDPEEPQLICTVRRHGYRLECHDH